MSPRDQKDSGRKVEAWRVGSASRRATLCQQTAASKSSIAAVSEARWIRRRRRYRVRILRTGLPSLWWFNSTPTDSGVWAWLRGSQLGWGIPDAKPEAPKRRNSSTYLRGATHFSRTVKLISQKKRPGYSNGSKRGSQYRAVPAAR